MPSLPPPPDIPEGLEHLLHLFVGEMSKDAAGLTALGPPSAQADGAAWTDFADHAHAMRGKAGLFGETRLYDLLTEVERLALQRRVEGMAALMERVVERVAELEVYGREIPAGPQ